MYLTKYVYDGDHIALVFDDADGPGGNAPTLAHRMLHGPTVDMILAEEDLSESYNDPGRTLWPLGDHLGSIRDVMDTSPGSTTPVNHVQYDSFGNVIGDPEPSMDSFFGYTGRERDEESDLNYYRARYYDPELGRFISKDPIGFAAGDVNQFRYVGNGPTNATDPSGAFSNEELPQQDKEHTKAITSPEEPTRAQPVRSLPQRNAQRLNGTATRESSGSRDSNGGFPGYQGIGAMRHHAEEIRRYRRLTQVTIFTDNRGRGWKPEFGTCELNGAVNNEELISMLETHVKHTGKKIQVLYIAGHGYGAGIKYAGNNGDKGFHTNTLTDDQVKRLKAVLTRNAEIVLYGCRTAGNKKRESDAQKLADRLARTVWGTNYNTHPCYEGDTSRPKWAPVWLNMATRWAYGEEPIWDRFRPK
jgi:RHS repeat-associated protein